MNVTSLAQADTFNYVCENQGRLWPLKVDDAKNVLEWRDTIYRLKDTEDCAKFGWRVEKDDISFDICTATHGHANFKLGGKTVQCSLERH